jgi:hyperosmotically inducible periplasmic protein
MNARPITLLLLVPAAWLLNGGAALNGAAAAQQSENYIQREVLHELRMLPYYTVFDDLKFQVQGTHVTLSGEVVNPTLKSDAVAAVKHIQGVTDVTDDIKVLPLSPDDQRIRAAEYRAIYGEPQLQKYAWAAVQGIHIIVDTGHVTLEGVVDNESDKNVANIRANSVPGVFSVQNNLQVAGPR